MFPAGTKLVWKNGEEAYQKLDNEEYGNWRSLEYDLDKPLADRWGWKWADQQVKDYYSGIMNFVLPF